MNARAAAAHDTLQPMFTEFAALRTDDLDPDSLGGAIFAAADRGDIDPAIRVDMLWNLTGPAIDTTISALGTVLLRLASAPEQWELVRADESMALNAVNEAVRYDSPIQSFTRYARSACELGGSEIPAGSRVVVMYGSANRDERRFPDPDTFDIRRAATDHLGFGFGAHACLGSQLARLEIESFLKALAARVRSMEAGEPVRRICNLGRKLESLPITVRG
jgi:cytochrome P450